MTTPSVHHRRGRTTLVVERISEQLYSILCERITSGEYAPGSRLDPQAIASEFGVSRTPVRDTLARLEHDRLVETRPRSGTFVTRPTRQDVHEVCQLRKGLEWLATGVAAETMPLEQIADLRNEAVNALRAAEQGDYEPFFASDTRIHHDIVATTGNSRLITARESVEPFVYWLRVLGATGPHRLAGSTHRHLEILDAMAARNPAAAQEAAAIHLTEVEEWTLADMASHDIVT
ncbi:MULTISPECIES: GntR family transcriptional regulator [Streptomyces]|uniref:HTH gntR-type domain-containing protein n=1 Tax=Streptomyces malaysiensis TaxID=92644 RepID=A0A2J7Z1K1_STRMQ|nr:MULTISPECIES: GntR family transcriptional regulator [Streptomyces]WJJ61158.1 gntR family transcriptional regulator [Streptomyces sp.]AUA16965.1 putative HTH-type transcriptional regulator YdfH [Streptomyces sp. M56]MCC4319409.1 GntR family transcriptional regulator [Streptomyces malaysiensis]MCD9589331.1 GntR family transcriptional regulator [Streptomyces sp. 8ZJF_21]MCM3811006.1 GntR family transcriptional regulator [Streptomyces sp. DR7-3]